MTILSARAVADMLGMTRHHLYSMAAAGEIPAAKVADQGGPIIECEIHTLIERDGIWTAECFWPKYPHPSRFCYSISGPTPLIAAMRTHVASRLGPCVEVPSELW